MVLAPYRITPWPELTEDADVYEARLRATTSRLRLIVLGTFGAIAAASVVTLVEGHSRLLERHRSETQRMAQIATVREVVGAARSFAVNEQARFAAAMNEALAEGPTSSDDPIPCVSTTSGADVVIVGDEEGEIESPSLANVLADATHAEEHLNAGEVGDAFAIANALAHRIASPTAWPRYDAALVTTNIHAPVVTGTSSFEPGEVSGRVYLYDFSKHRVTCVGTANASSSPQVEYSLARSSFEGPLATRLTARLDEDLHRQVLRAVDRASLVSVDPSADKTKRREP